MFRAFIGLGSNLGDRIGYLQRGVDGIVKFCEPVQCSSVYETDPVEMSSKHRFLNAVIEVRTAEMPRVLFDRLRRCERLLGRARETHLRDRTIDLDLICYEGLVYKDEMVEVPHPRMKERRFVLEPLNEIAPELVLDTTGKTAADALLKTADRSVVTRTGLTLKLPSIQSVTGASHT